MRNTLALLVAILCTVATGVYAGTENGSYNSASTLTAAAHAGALHQGADGTAGVAAVFRGGNGSAGVGGLGTFAGGNGVGTNQPSGGAILSTGLATGTGTSDAVIQTSYTLATGTTVQTAGDRHRICGKTKALSTTTATLTTFAKITMATTLTSCGGTCFYTIKATSAAAIATTVGHFDFVVQNTAATLAITAGTITDVKAGASGTITSGATVTATTTTLNLNVTPAFTTIVPTAVVMTWQIVLDGDAATIVVQ